MVEARFLINSISFGETADAWATNKGLLDEDGQVSAGFPVIIGMPEGSTDLGAFNIGLIQNNRTIKQALQDLETSTNGRMLASNNLSDLPNKSTARTNLGLGSASTWNTGTSGAAVPLLNTVNSWSGKQSFTGGLNSTSTVDITNPTGSVSGVNLQTAGVNRWSVLKNEDAESGTSTGANFVIRRCDNTGTAIDDPVKISRATGIVTLSQPLPVESGGTGSNTLASLKTTLGLNNVNNTSDANKPISTATQSALDGKLDKIGGTISGSLYVTGLINSVNEMRVNSPDGTRRAALTTDGAIELCNPNSSYIDLKGDVSVDWDIRLTGTNSNKSLAVLSKEGLVVDTSVGSWSGLFKTNTQYSVFNLQNTWMNSSRVGYTHVDLLNESGTQFASIAGYQDIDGGSALYILTTPAGNRAVDRRSTVAVFATSGVTFNVPINGRAYPRNGAGGAINFNWNGQGGQPEWLWGGSNGTDMYVYNPLNFSVNYAGSAGQASKVVRATLGGTNADNLVEVTMADNDNFRIRAGGDASNSGWVEFAVADDGNEKMLFRQYNGPNWQNITRTLTLLDENGNTGIPGQLYCNMDVQTNSFIAIHWFISLHDRGIWWQGRGRGLTVSDNGGNYGQVNINGNGKNGWNGYSIHTYGSFMANSDTIGIHSDQRGGWLVNWDTNSNAWFPQNITAYSDERLKQNKRPIDNITLRRRGMATSAIMYERDGKTRLGFGAQTLEKTVPEVVFTADDLLGTKSVNYMDMVSILAVDADNLDERITKLEQENQTLRTLVNSLTQRLDAAGL